MVRHRRRSATRRATHSSAAPMVITLLLLLVAGVAFVLLRWGHLTLRSVFWWAAVPGIFAFIVLLVAVKDVERPAAAPAEQSTPDTGNASLGGRFWAYLTVVLLFTLGNSTDAFLLLRANQLGVAVAFAPILWALLNFTKAALGTWGGSLSGM